MNSQKKRHLVRSLSVLLLMLGLLTLILRLWPILLLMLLAIFGYALWMLVCIQKAPEQAQSEQPVRPVPQPSADLPTERDMLASAFDLLQRRVTEQVVASYPDARWIWSVSNALSRFSDGEGLEILLNGAGGYRRASVLVQNLQFCGLSFHASTQDTESGRDEDGESEDGTLNKQPNEQSEEPVDYGLLAFEWVSANITRLIAQSSEAIAQGKETIHIQENELPHGDSWQAICGELICNGFDSAEPVADGIIAKIKFNQ